MLAGNFSWVTDLTDTLGDWASNWWFLGVIFIIAFLDSVIPVVPSETTVIIGGVAAASTGADAAPYGLILVIAAGASGAFLGDNAAYAIGRRFSPRFERRAARKEKFDRRLEWARTQIRLRGGMLLITARFIPGGRTILTLSSGITRQPRPWFILWTAIAATIWATYAAGLAYVIGDALEENQTLAFWVAFGTALSITVLIEIVRHFRNKGHADEALTTDGASAEQTS
jgi:membrane protein DedA with SNARE-associated domain